MRLSVFTRCAPRPVPAFGSRNYSGVTRGADGDPARRARRARWARGAGLDSADDRGLGPLRPQVVAQPVHRVRGDRDQQPSGRLGVVQQDGRDRVGVRLDVDGRLPAGARGSS